MMTIEKNVRIDNTLEARVTIEFEDVLAFIANANKGTLSEIQALEVIL